LPKRNPGLELANAFSVIHFRWVLSSVGVDSTLCAKHCDDGHRDYCYRRPLWWAPSNRWEGGAHKERLYRIK